MSNGKLHQNAAYWVAFFISGPSPGLSAHPRKSNPMRARVVLKQERLNDGRVHQ